MKRLLCLILAIFFSVLMIASPSIGLMSVKASWCSSFSNWDKTFSLDNKTPGEKLAAVAVKQEGKDRGTLGYSNAWCAYFIEDCAELAGVSNAIPKTVDGYAYRVRDIILSTGGRKVNYADAQIGDIVTIDWNGAGGVDHVEIVYKVVSGLAYTVGGNCGNSPGVVKVRNKSSSEYIKGLISGVYRPNYDENTPAPGESTLSINPTTCPSGTLTYGESFSLQGTVSSNYPVNYFKGVIYNSAYEVEQSASCYPNSYSVDIRSSNINQNLIFNQLEAGSYYLYYYATDTSGMSKDWCSGWFTISGGSTKPAKPTVSVPKSTYSVGDSIPITWNAVAGNADYRMDIYRNGSAIVETSMGQSTSYTYENASAGLYTVYVSANNSAGWSGSSSCDFVVKDYVTISFDANGGTVSPSTKVIEQGTEIGTLPTPTKDGYSFAGWIKNNGYGCSVIQPSTVFTAAETLYATWAINPYSGNHIRFDSQGGSVNGEVLRASPINAFNAGRDTDWLVVYNCPGESVHTNYWGVEVAVNSEGQVIETRGYLCPGILTVPSGGCIVSGHGKLIDFVASIEIGSYVAYDQDAMMVYNYSNYEKYLEAHKYLPTDDVYGNLPCPQKTSSYFLGWSPNEDGSSIINYLSNYSVSTLYAKWDSTPIPVATTEFNNHLYELYDYHMSWSEAEAFCESLGGHLVTITNADEQANVLELAKAGSFCTYYIGCTDSETEGIWKWVTGESFEYQNWDDAGEPNGGNIENCAHILTANYGPYKQVGEWNDCQDTLQHGFYGYMNGGFVCEFESPCKHNYTPTEIKATCTEGGYTTYTCSLCGDSYVADYTSAFGHDWADPIYVWEDGNSSVTASRICKNDSEHYESETVIPIVEITVEPTLVTPGEMTVTAVFESAGFESQTKSIEIPRIENPFKDVSQTAYYYDAVVWAVHHTPQITTGSSDSSFSPQKTCTRSQIVTFLWRAAGSPNPSSTDCQFTDVPETAFYRNAVLWAYEQGITAGTSISAFSPHQPCTRAQAVTLLWRAMGSPTVENDLVSPFLDVRKGIWYYDAVLWAVENNITTGTTATKFSPNRICSRAEIVTFLFRAFGEN